MRSTVYVVAATLAFICSTKCQAQHLEKPLAVVVNDLRSTDVDVRSLALARINQSFLAMPLGEFAGRDWEDLRSFRQQAEPLLPNLLELLDSSNDDMVRASLRLIARMGTKARGAVPKLKLFAVDQNRPRELRWDAVRAFCFVENETTPVVSLVLPSLKTALDMKLSDVEDDPVLPNGRYVQISMVAGLVVQLLRDSGHTKSEVVDLLEAASQEQPAEVRSIAVATLGGLGPEAESAVPELTRLLGDEDPFVRRFAASSVLQIEREAAAISVLADRLALTGSEREEFESESREFFADREQWRIEMSTWAREAPDLLLPALVSTLKADRAFHRRWAIRTLAEIGPSAKSAAPQLRTIMREGDPEMRRLACIALQQIDP